jgi:8-amino-7-oxononanoate synthase
MQKKYEYWEKELKNIAEKQQFRAIKNIQSKSEKFLFFENNKYLNLSSNNYLGIADNQKVLEQFKEEVYNKNLYSFGSASSRLLTGTIYIYNELENLIAKLYSKDKALLFNNGYQANTGIIGALADKNDVVFSDKLNHASIIDGMKLSGADFYRYKHLDYENLENLLSTHRNKYRNAILVTESLFSMNGDIVDLERIVRLKREYNLIIVLDEAHAFGIFGENALGVCEDQNFIEEIDIIIGTFGKAVGSMGAFAVAKEFIIDYLINKARPFIFSTALPPVNIAFSKWALENIVCHSLEKRKKLLELSEKFRNELIKKNISTGGKSHIVPIILGDNQKTFEVSEKLLKQGYWMLPIRPPTVPEGTSRLRVSLTTEICWEDIKEIPSMICEVL